jgi:hypothetical protein
MISPSQFLTFLAVLYSHLLAPTLPDPISNVMKNPLVKTLGLFWLLYHKTQNWKFSLLVASGMVVLLEGGCYMMYGREAFCNFDKNRWCASKDLCFDETTESTKVESFLNSTDDFIKSLYKYVEADSPEAIERA